MKLKKLISEIMLVLLLISTWFCGFNIQPASASGTVYIRADGSIDPPDAAVSTLDKVTYTLTGNVTSSDDGIVVQRDNIVLDGAGYAVQATSSGLGRAGVDLSKRINVTIKNMSIRAFSWGIYLDSSLNNSVSGNNITNNNYGIAIFSSSNNAMHGNNITENGSGIWLFASSNNSILENKFTDDGLFFLHAYGNFVWNNIVNSRPLVYLENVSDHTVRDAGQVILVRCENTRVEGCNLSNTDCGVQLLETGNSTISGNNIAANTYGIWLSGSSNNSISGNNMTANHVYGIVLSYSPRLYSLRNSISGNTITNNGDNGIIIQYSNYTSISGNTIATNDRDDGVLCFTSDHITMSENTITNNHNGISLHNSNHNSICGNIIANNSWGMWIDSSSNSSIYHNNFVSNTRQVDRSSSDSINVWDDSYPSGGNYWSDYNGTEFDAYGIGSEPYIIDANNSDRFPFKSPYLSGDINHDLVVNILDVAIVAKAFGCKPGDSNWNPVADMDRNEVINIVDVSKVARVFGKEWRGQT